MCVCACVCVCVYPGSLTASLSSSIILAAAEYRVQRPPQGRTDLPLSEVLVGTRRMPGQLDHAPLYMCRSMTDWFITSDMSFSFTDRREGRILEQISPEKVSHKTYFTVKNEIKQNKTLRFHVLLIHTAPHPECLTLQLSPR